MRCRKPSGPRSVIRAVKSSPCVAMAASRCRWAICSTKASASFRNTTVFVELEMKAAGFVDFATDLDNPDFAKMAVAAGLLGLTAERPEQVQPMIAQAFAHDGPALVEVPVHRRELAMPPTISLDQVTGFGIFMIRAVLSGRGDEIVDLAKTNLWR